MFTHRREVFGWAIYDFAASGFTTPIAGIILSTFFATVLANGRQGMQIFGRQVPGATLWAFALAISAVLVAVTGPVLGALADAGGHRKRFLIIGAVAGSLAAMLMVLLSGPQHVWLAFCLFIVANSAGAAALVFYNAFLPEIAEPSEVGRVSGFGWAAGYLGGGLCLALSLAIISKPDWFGISSAAYWPLRLTFLIAGAWWLLLFTAYIPRPQRESCAPIRPAADAPWQPARSRLHAAPRAALSRPAPVPDCLLPLQ